MEIKLRKERFNRVIIMNKDGIINCLIYIIFHKMLLQHPELKIWFGFHQNYLKQKQFGITKFHSLTVITETMLNN